MFGLGTTELIIILVLFMAIFGLGKIPKVARQLGLGVRNFKDSMEGKDVDDSDEVEAVRLEDKSATQLTRDAAMPQGSEQPVERSADGM